MKSQTKFWTDIRCNSWKSFWRGIEKLPGLPEYYWIFRGQANSEWRLEPTIERGFDLNHIAGRECDLYEGFNAKAHLYSSRLPLQNDHLSWIAMMQHHGCPTRLLDWTYSPLVAAFFALSEFQPAKHAAIWALSKSKLTVEDWWQTKEKSIVQSSLKVVLDEHSTRAATKNKESLVRICTPGFESQRMSSQQGCFLYNCNLTESFQDGLVGMVGGDRGWAYRFLIPQSTRDEFLKKLLWMNVHDVSLFPDLDGLGRFLKMKADLFGS